MSITKSYNKHTGVYYAYDTTYEWDEERQKKVQHKRCIGKFDPITGEVIPNGKVGRPSRSLQNSAVNEYLIHTPISSLSCFLRPMAWIKTIRTANKTNSASVTDQPYVNLVLTNGSDAHKTRTGNSSGKFSRNMLSPTEFSPLYTFMHILI